MPDWLETGIRAFNAGLYFEAHEVWEDLWRQSSGSTKSFIQGLVQVAVGLHHWQRGNRAGGRRVLGRGLARLEAAPTDCCGIDSIRLIQNIRAFLDGDIAHPIRIRPGSVDSDATGK